jgi:outer membrane protein OmpA-like peptidoglycan-associated protein
MFSAAVRTAFLALLVASIPAVAQSPGRVEIGGFLQWSVFDESLRMDDFFATGGRAGVFLSPAFAIEADVARTSTNGPPGVNVTYWPLHARLIYNRVLAGRVTGLAGAGYVHNLYGGSRDASDDGLSALVGVRIPISSQFAVRLDVNADYMPSPANRSSTVRSNWNLGVRQGLSVLLGGRRASRQQQLPPAAPLAAAPRVQDSDGDGVTDQWDRCPSTATGVRVDASGCPLDADADGVIDIHDRCPNTPAGTGVDVAGCPLDSDQDGVPNALDRCADTPAGTAVGSTGCALDSDADGVPDPIDRCPGTSAGTRVDAWGCLLLFEENRKSLILEGVNFADGRAELTPESSSILDNVAASLLANKTVRVVVEGHTSSTGSRVLNLGLSWARAAAVRDYLIAREVSPDRLVARGFGPDRPIATNATPEGQAKNRRVELRKTSEEDAR